MELGAFGLLTSPALGVPAVGCMQVDGANRGPASATALPASLRGRFGNVGLALNGRPERAASAGEAVLPDVSPEGERTTWSLSFGAVWGSDMFRGSQ